MATLSCSRCPSFSAAVATRMPPDQQTPNDMVRLPRQAFAHSWPLIAAWGHTRPHEFKRPNTRLWAHSRQSRGGICDTPMNGLLDIISSFSKFFPNLNRLSLPLPLKMAIPQKPPSGGELAGFSPRSKNRPEFPIYFSHLANPGRVWHSSTAGFPGILPPIWTCAVLNLKRSTRRPKVNPAAATPHWWSALSTANRVRMYVNLCFRGNCHSFPRGWSAYTNSPDQPHAATAICTCGLSVAVVAVPAPEQFPTGAPIDFVVWCRTKTRPAEPFFWLADHLLPGQDFDRLLPTRMLFSMQRHSPPAIRQFLCGRWSAWGRPRHLEAWRTLWSEIPPCAKSGSQAPGMDPTGEPHERIADLFGVDLPRP
jgi:hypothetical protein